MIEALEVIVIAGVALTAEALGSGSDAAELTLPMWRVLVVLGSQPDGATVSEVSRRIGVTVPATSRQLRRLETRGLVSLRTDDRDHRAVRARLTEEGARLRERIMDRRRQALRAALRPLTVSDATVREMGSIAALLRPLA